MNAIKLLHTKSMSEEEWREHRHQGIGGSDVSAILGINKWRTALQVYMEKTKQWEPDDLSENQAVHFGHKLEQIVADEFAERTGWKVKKCNYVLQHPHHEFMRANIDREITHPERGRGVLECKTTSAWNKDEWSGEHVPEAYMVQVQHYLAVTGYNFAYIAVLIGGNSYDHWLIERDDELIAMIIAAEENFWHNHIKAGVPPAINYSLDGSEILDRLYPAAEAVDKQVDIVGDRATELLNKIWAAQQEVKELKAEEEAAKNELKDYMQQYEIGVHEGAKITWRAPKPKEAIDEAELQAKYPEVWSELKYTKPAKRTFRITFKK